MRDPVYKFVSIYFTNEALARKWCALVEIQRKAKATKKTKDSVTPKQISMAELASIANYQSHLTLANPHCQVDAGSDQEQKIPGTATHLMPRHQNLLPIVPETKSSHATPTPSSLVAKPEGDESGLPRRVRPAHSASRPRLRDTSPGNHSKNLPSRLFNIQQDQPSQSQNDSSNPAASNDSNDNHQISRTPSKTRVPPRRLKSNSAATV
jgi:hypothetical protein